LEANSVGQRIINHEDYFFSETWDIPETEWLEKAVYILDKARLNATNAGYSEPLCLRVKDSNTYQVKLANGTEEKISVMEAGDTRTATGVRGTCDARLEPPGFWKTVPGSDDILAAVLMLHQAIHPKYKIAADQK
jgi:hypothetical protein